MKNALFPLKTSAKPKGTDSTRVRAYRSQRACDKWVPPPRTLFLDFEFTFPPMSLILKGLDRNPKGKM